LDKVRFIYAKLKGFQFLKGEVMCISKKVINKKTSLSNIIKKWKKMGVRRFSASCILLMVFCSLTLASGTWQRGSFEIHMFSVGQADSQLIVSPAGKTLLSRASAEENRELKAGPKAAWPRITGNHGKYVCGYQLRGYAERC
jgi:hypothetical protein